MRARVGTVEAIDVGGDEQCIGIDQRRYGRSQVVVVAKLEFVHRYSVVLVDHRQCPQPQQLVEGGACVEVTAAVAQIVMGQQHLRHRALEEALPQTDQLRLAKCRQCLSRRHRRTRLIGPGQDRATGSHRAGGDDDHFAPSQHIGRDELGQAQRVTR
ncbi:hypothetical protein D3C81_339860 [compost metagenome]